MGEPTIINTCKYPVHVQGAQHSALSCNTYLVYYLDIISSLSTPLHITNCLLLGSRNSALKNLYPILLLGYVKTIKLWQYLRITGGILP